MSETSSDVRPKFPTVLKHWKYEIERIARKVGLTFNPVIYEMVDYAEMSELAAYGAYPVRWHHWLWGQESLKGKQAYRWGLSVIYEMVIPTIPCYAYLLDVNSTGTNKSIMAHVYGHADFFKNNVWFKDMPGNIHHILAMHAAQMDALRIEHGKEKVDQFLECCLSLDNLLDLMAPVIRRMPKVEPGRNRDKRYPKRIEPADRLPDYMDEYINPKGLLRDQERRIEEEDRLLSEIERGLKVPAAPVQDILGFLLQYAQLENWQRDIVEIIHDETVTLWMGGLTKIMNEGWAAFWQDEIMASEGVGLDSEVCSLARLFAGVLGSPGLNPYRLGKQLWDDVKLRWDTGRHGEVWEDCKQADIVDRWDEYVVFHNIFLAHRDNPDVVAKAWREFSTFAQEAKAGRGRLGVAWFQKKALPTEWTNYQNSNSKRLKDLQGKKVKLAEFEGRIQERVEVVRKEGRFTDEELSSLKFKVRVELYRDLPESLRYTTTEDLDEEIRRCEFYLDLQCKIERAEIELVSLPIAACWSEWVGRYPEPIALGRGLEKMFEVRETHNDVSFIREFFTQEFCERYQYFTVGKGKAPDDWWDEKPHYILNSRSYKRVLNQLLQGRINLNQPKIALIDANYNNARELYLLHLHDGRDLDTDTMKDVLERLHKVWGWETPVHLETIETEWPRRRSYWERWRPPWILPPPPERIERRRIRYVYDPKNKRMEKIILAPVLETWDEE